MLDQIAALHLVEPVTTPGGEGQSFLLRELADAFARELAFSQE